MDVRPLRARSWGPRPPLTLLLRTSTYTASLVIALAVVLQMRAAVASRSHDAAAMLGAGALALFVATLALTMNGFLSVQLVYPWGPLALTSGSLAATLLLGGAVVAAGTRGEGSRV